MLMLPVNVAYVHIFGDDHLGWTMTCNVSILYCVCMNVQKIGNLSWLVFKKFNF